MKIKNLETATKYYESIKKLDAEILELDKLAMLVADGNCNPKINITIDNLAEMEKKLKARFDEDGSLINPNSEQQPRFMMFNPFNLQDHYEQLSKKKEELTISLNCNMEENATLQILGVLLLNKQEKRNLLITKLNQLGIQ